MAEQFDHIGLHLKKEKPIVYPALSKHRFYLRMIISAFILKQEAIPLNPFMIFDYYLADLVERDTIREANNNLVRISDEVWVFGEVSNGVLAEILSARAAGKLSGILR